VSRFPLLGLWRWLAGAVGDSSAIEEKNSDIYPMSKLRACLACLQKNVIKRIKTITDIEGDKDNAERGAPGRKLAVSPIVSNALEIKEVSYGQGSLLWGVQQLKLLL
jgi:hypothetical protein